MLAPWKPPPLPPPVRGSGARTPPAALGARSGAASVGATLVLAGGMALTARHTASNGGTSASGTTQNTIASSNFGESESDDSATSANSSIFGSIATPAQSGVGLAAADHLHQCQLNGRSPRWARVPT